MSLGALQPQEGTWSSPSWVWGGSVLGASFCHGASPPSETGAGGVLLGTGAEMFKRLFAAWLWLSWHGAAASGVMLSWKDKQQREGFTGRGSSSGVWGHPLWYGVWSTSGAACRYLWPPWPWFGVHDHLMPRAGSTWRKQRLGTGHNFVGICLLLAAGGAGGRGSRTDPCEQTSRVFSGRGR